MTAHTLGVLTLLSLAVALVSCRTCCPGSMPLVPTEDGLVCQNFSKISLMDSCSSFYIADEVFKEIVETSEIEFESAGFKTDKYCTGIIVNSSYAVMRGVEDQIGKVVTLLCFHEYSSDEQEHYTVYSVCLLTSSVFLFITLVFYLLLPELRDLQGKCVLFLVLSLLLGLTSLAIIQLPNVITDVQDHACVLMAMTTYFWMLSAFFWLNINCFNIWRSSVLAHKNMSEQRLLVFYHVTGWGFPILFLAFALITHHIPGKDHLQPNFGVTSCWFQGKLEKWVFFYSPVMFLLILNFIYFFSTARMLWQEYRSPNPLPRVQALRFKFCLYLKLFLAMGITWIFEILSAIREEPWFVTDIINCLQGVIIFLLMIVFRKRVWHLLAAKRPCGIHLFNCWDQLVDEETLEGGTEQQTTMQEETRAYALVENGTKQQATVCTG